MLSKNDEEILTDRLRNWGRWAADSQHSATDMIYRLMLLSGEIKLSDDDGTKVDLADALLVERAWKGLPQTPRRYLVAKWVLAAHYAYPRLSVFRFCQYMHIRKREYEDLLRLAHYMIYNRLDQHAAKNLAAHSS
jgi:hypothetical protein